MPTYDLYFPQGATWDWGCCHHLSASPAAQTQKSPQRYLFSDVTNIINPTFFFLNFVNDICKVTFQQAFVWLLYCSEAKFIVPDCGG